VLERAVVGGFCSLGKTAAGKLSGFEVVGNALAAEALLGTSIIGAVALFHVFFLITFHEFFSSGDRILFCSVVGLLPQRSRPFKKSLNQGGLRMIM